ncbi:MAG: hypothetical protein ACXVJT_12595, partial [Thermoanaerobaculia bacterium]
MSDFSRQRTEVGVVVACAFWFLACGQTSTPVVEPAPPPASVPVAASEPLPSTIAEAESALRNGRADLYEQGLRALATSADPLTRRRALGLLGLYSLDQKRWDDAFKFLTDAADANPPIAAFLRLRLIDIEVTRGNLDNAIAIAQGIIAATPDSSSAAKARLRLPALIAQQPATAATPSTVPTPSPLDLAFADAMLVPIDSLTEEEFVRLADGLETCGRADLATDVRMHLLTRYAGGRYAETTYRKAAAATPSPLDSLPFEQALAIASDLASADRYDQAFDL